MRRAIRKQAERCRARHPSRLSAVLLLVIAASMSFTIWAVTGCSQNYNGLQNASVRDHPDEGAEKLPAEKISEHSTTGTGDNDLIVRFIDVGQGDCALISQGGEYLLIDGGPSEASSKVYAILKRLGIEHLDFIIATHPDADHIGGISGALNYASCGTCFCSTTQSDTKTFESMVRYLGRRGVTITVPNPGDTIAVGDASVRFLGPSKLLDGDNNNSLVCRIDYGSTSFLFTGDAEIEEEQSLLTSGADVSANVLKVAHHGSSNSSSPRFINAVNPEYAIVSVGKSNTYGHPTQVVLDDLQKAGAEVLRTDEVGSVLFHSDGNNLSYSTTQGAIDE